MPKQMTEARAWRKVGRAIEKAGEMPHGCGLCREMQMIGNTPWEWSYGSTRITDHIEASAKNDDDPAKWVYSKDWEARCLAAYWLAMECAEEDAGNP